MRLPRPILYFSQSELSRLRLNNLGYFIFICFLILAGRLFYLQVIKGPEFYRQSENNCLRVIRQRAVRGFIYDREKRILAGNRPVYSLYVIPQDVPHEKSFIQTLAEILQMSSQEIEEIIVKGEKLPFEPVKVKEDIGKDLAGIIEERRNELPGVFIETEAQRYYPAGEIGVHFLGYVGEISGEDFLELKDQDYRLGDIVGRTGIEKVYDHYLRGEDGGVWVEVNAYGKQLNVVTVKDSGPGANLILTIDKHLQEIAEEAMSNQTGAVVILDPATGEILAMVSKPGYDPNLLSHLVSREQWEKLATDPRHPLINRSLQGLYPPGSIFKLVTATAALSDNRIRINEYVFCPGTFTVGSVPHTYSCWQKNGHGLVNIVEAIKVSCNIFFYQLSLRVGINNLRRYAYLYGLGRTTGIDLPSENPGLVPGPQWKRLEKGEPWYYGDTIIMSIGQGFLLVTPLHMANMIAAIGNGGTLFRPHLVKRIETTDGKIIKEFPPEKMGELNVPAEVIKILRQGLWAAVNESGGTGRSGSIPGAEVAGKTATAQNPTGEDHGWFIAFAPFEKPQLAIAVLVEHGKFGASSAAPLARKIISRYLGIEEEDKLIRREEEIPLTDVGEITTVEKEEEFLPLPEEEFEEEENW